jgi:hypothetical protein
MSLEIKSFFPWLSFMSNREEAEQSLTFDALSVVFKDFDEMSLLSTRLVCPQFVPMIRSIVIHRQQEQLNEIVGFLKEQLLLLNSPASLKAIQDIEELMKHNHLNQLVRLTDVKENFGNVLDLIVDMLGDLDYDTELRVLSTNIKSAIPTHPALKSLGESFGLVVFSFREIKKGQHLFHITEKAHLFIHDKSYASRFPLEFGKRFSQPERDLYYTKVSRSYADGARSYGGNSTLKHALEAAQLIEDSRFRDYCLIYLIHVCLEQKEIGRLTDMRPTDLAASLISDPVMKLATQLALMSPTASIGLGALGAIRSHGDCRAFFEWEITERMFERWEE